MRFGNNPADFLVNKLGAFITVVAVFGSDVSQKRGNRLLPVGPGTQLVAHAEIANHLVGNFRGPLQIVLGSGGNIAESQLFGHPAAKQDGNLVQQLQLGSQKLLLHRQLQSVAQGSYAPGNDGNLVHRLAGRYGYGNQGMAGFMVGNPVLLLLAHGVMLLFRTGDNPLDGIFKIFGGHSFPPAAGREDGRFIGHVGQVGAHQSRRPAGDEMQIHVLGQLQLLGMDLQDRFPPLQIRLVNHDLAVEAPGPQQGLVKDFRAVGGRQHHHPLAGVKTVDFHQQLVQGLLPLVVAAHGQGAAALPADGIQLINENNAGSLFAGLIKKVPHPGRPDADKHFDEFRTADTEKRNSGFAGNRLGQQGFPGSRRSHQQDAFRHMPSKALEVLGIFQKLDNLFQLQLRLFHAGHIFESHLGLFTGMNPGFMLADVQKVAAHAAQPPGNEPPDGENKQHRQNPAENQVVQPVVIVANRVLHPVLVQLLHQHVVLEGHGGKQFRPSLLILDFQGAGDLFLADDAFDHLVVVQIFLELAVGNDLALLPQGGLEKIKEGKHQDEIEQGEIPRVLPHGLFPGFVDLYFRFRGFDAKSFFRHVQILWFRAALPLQPSSGKAAVYDRAFRLRNGAHQ